MARSQRFVDETPAAIVTTLLEEGTYLESESTFYRCLRAERKVKHRRETKPGQSLTRPPERVATTGPTKFGIGTSLGSKVRSMAAGIMPTQSSTCLWSRLIIGWEVHERESADIVATMFERLKLFDVL